MDIALNLFIENIASNAVGDLYNGVKSLLPTDLSEKLKEKQQSLDRLLPQVKAVMHMVNNRGLGLLESDQELIQWSWQFKDAIEAAEDVLDEIRYNQIEKEVSGSVSSTESSGLSIFAGIKRKLGDYLGTNSRSADTERLKKETAERLEKVVEELDKVVTQMLPFLMMGLPSRDARCQEHEKFVNGREATGLEVAQMVGREDESAKIIKWLIEDQNSINNMENKIQVYTIVGEGGMGKTTLARSVKNDPSLIGRFDLILWVCVSTEFDKKKITQALIQEIKKDQILPESLNGLQTILADQLRGKTFFLVLDDVWDMDNRDQWDTLMAPLKVAKKGSKILVTTRLNSVSQTIANVIGTRKDELILEGLKQNDFLQLFRSYAFASSDPECHKELKLIGDEIAKKLGGYPLAAKILGDQLNKNKDEAYWHNILEKQNKIDADKEKEGFKANLRLSYQKLDTSLQKCFRFCSIFPKGFKFEEDELIHMWIGSGSILEKNQYNPLETTGREYINYLKRESFFIKSNGSTSCYVMGEFSHDVARSVSVEECLTIEDAIIDTNFSITIRHLYISAEAKEKNLFQGIAQLKKLRSLIIDFKGNDPQGNHLALLSLVLTALQSLRVLSLTASFSCKLPEEIGSLIHLRHLSIHQTTKGSQLEWFPESVYKLYNLRILRFLGGSGGSYSRVNFKDLTNLVNLRHLEIPSTIKDRIPYIGKLAHLQGSLNFQVKKDEGYKITELKNLNGISELCIFSLEEASIQEAKEVNLVKKSRLKSLKLIWSNDSNRDPVYDRYIADELCPPEKLRQLTIKGYNGEFSPRWVMMFSAKTYFLRSISLIQCHKWNELLDLTRLPLLKVLEIKDVGLVNVPKIFESSVLSQEATSSSLKKLEIKYCMKLENLQPIGFKNISSLKTLLIGSCPNLNITQANAEFLPTALEKLSIGSCRNLEIHLSTSLLHLTSLKNLSLENCASVTTLPDADVFTRLTALTSLEIKDCAELKSLGGLEALPLLHSLTIFGCKKLIEVSLRQLQSYTATNFVDERSTIPMSTLKILNVDKESLLTIVPPRKLTAVEEIKIGNASDVNTFQALVATMGMLTYLRKLYMCNATQVSSLPNFPNALQSLHLCNTSDAFRQQYQNTAVFNVRSVELAKNPCTTSQSFMSDLEFDRRDLR